MNKTKEEWREIFDGYLVSNRGQVKSVNFHRTGTEKLLTQSNNGRYKAVNIKGTVHYIHRLVAAAFVPNPENKTDVSHIDEDPLNNNADNLEWVNRNEKRQKEA